MTVRLLVVEDEATIAVTLEAVLAGEGYDVATAGCAAEALEQLGSQPFDLALLDLHLGDDDGLQVLSRMEEITPGTSAIVLTGYGSLETAIKAMRSGAADYLLKPCDVGELKAAIVRALQRRPSSGDAAPPSESVAAQADGGPDQYLEVACREIKTPLTAVIGWAQYAKRRLAAGATVEACERLDTVLQEAWRTAHLVDAFHGVARLGRAEPQLGLDPIDLRRVLEAAVGTMHAEYGRRRYLLSLPERPVLVGTLPAALIALFTTLMESALHSSAESVDAGVFLVRTEHEAIVSVRLETARGSAAAVIDALTDIEPAYPADQLTHPGGLAIGLHLARRLSEAYGGRIWVERAADGVGIAFCVALPLATPPD